MKAPDEISIEELCKTARAKLQQRVQEHPSYSAEEVEKIFSLERNLFPDQFRLDKDLTETFRAMCLLSQVELKPPQKITSHRPVIGPIIVAVKRLIYPLIKLHLKDVLQGMEEFCQWNIYQQARVAVSVKKLEQSSR